MTKTTAVNLTGDEIQTIMTMLDDEQCPEGLWAKLVAAQRNQPLYRDRQDALQRLISVVEDGKGEFPRRYVDHAILDIENYLKEPLTLMWTANLPTVPGWYWYRSNKKGEPMAVQIRELDGVTVRTVHTNVLPVGYMVPPYSQQGQWGSFDGVTPTPLQEPEG